MEHAITTKPSLFAAPDGCVLVDLKLLVRHSGETTAESIQALLVDTVRRACAEELISGSVDSGRAPMRFNSFATA